MKKIIVLMLIISVFMVGCSSSKDNSNQNANETEGSNVQSENNTPSVVFVVTGQLGDKSFNDSAANGIKMIEEKLGFETKIIEIGRDQTKWEPTFMDLSEEGKYDIIITNGSNAKEVVQSVATEFPDQKYILFDTEIEKGLNENVYSISYKQNEGSYLAGVLAALVTTSDMEYANEEKIIGFIGGSEHPIISDFLVGYIEGAQSVVPDIKVMVSYIGSWDDTAKGKETALAQFAQGVDITFPAAEQAGLGCVEAAVEMGKYIVGVDSDQAMLFKGVDEDKANVILTSVLKEVGNSLVRAMELDQKGELPWGEFESLGVAEGGAGIAINEYYEKNVPAEIATKVAEEKERVEAGGVDITSALGLPAEEVDVIVNAVKP
ncbi:BMP family ABC transporter substrate-binding protein [Vallitalea okinawensis]|uniref:BMP family ABC transporter substrate-binding protein n=1 Tax=Vallitalea okinawensis TaxID=2078660 RepID=UPI000CFC6AFA|nr:BMP family ABC transporter substrate-binding protein [Vallitalea okinawensis]